MYLKVVHFIYLVSVKLRCNTCYLFVLSNKKGFSCNILFLICFFLLNVWQVSYLAALFLILHWCNMYTVLRLVRKKMVGELKLRYKLRAIAYRLSNELSVLVRSDLYIWLHYVRRVHIYYTKDCLCTFPIGLLNIFSMVYMYIKEI